MTRGGTSAQRPPTWLFIGDAEVFYRQQASRGEQVIHCCCEFGGRESNTVVGVSREVIGRSSSVGVSSVTDLGLGSRELGKSAHQPLGADCQATPRSSGAAQILK